MSWILMDLLDEEVEEPEMDRNEEVDEHRHAKIKLLRERRKLRDSSNPLELNEIRFKKLFRLTKNVFVKLLEDVEEKMNGGKRSFSIPSILKLACLLRFCAEGSYQTGVSNDFNLGLGQSTISNILNEMFEIFDEYVCPKWIKFSYSRDDEEEAKTFFYNKSGISGIVGCIDGTHIKIRAPTKELQHLYLNKKGYFSINAMVACDHKMLIRYINARFPGACHDSHVFHMSGLKKILEEKRNGMSNIWILGDSRYPLSSYLITPFRSTDENSTEANFNKRHSSARIIVERTIGILKNRFRCLLGSKKLHYKPEKCTQIINTCVALHNICIQHGIHFEDVVESNEDSEMDENEDESVTNDEQLWSDGYAIRNRLLNSIL